MNVQIYLIFQNRAIATGFCLIIVGITTRNLARDIGLGKSLEPPTVKSICEKAYAHLGLGWFTGQSQLEICSSDGWSYSYQIILGVWYIFGSVCLSLIGNCTDAVVTFISFGFYILTTEFWVMVQQVGTSSSEEFNQVRQIKTFIIIKMEQIYKKKQYEKGLPALL